MKIYSCLLLGTVLIFSDQIKPLESYLVRSEPNVIESANSQSAKPYTSFCSHSLKYSCGEIINVNKDTSRSYPYPLHVKKDAVIMK